MTFTFNREVQFVPSGYIVVVENRPRFEGPMFLMGSLTIEPREDRAKELDVPESTNERGHRA